MNVLLIVCTLMSGLITADLDTITTVNGEVLHTNVRKVGKTSILFNETYYKARTVSDLKLSYISSIHFSDGFKVSFTDGVLNREGLLDSRIVKGIMNYSAEGLFNLTDEESGKIDDIGVKDRDFTSYKGPWSVVCSTLLMHYGLSMVVSAKASSPERVKSEQTLGAVPGGYGLTYKW